jgi:thioredoxin 1
MSISKVKEIQSTEFDSEVLQARELVLVEFGAEWCGPCVALMPTLQDLAHTYEGRVKIVKIDVDENRDLAAQFQIKGMPTVIVFKQGQVQTRIIGRQAKPVYMKAIESFMT